MNKSYGLQNREVLITLSSEIEAIEECSQDLETKRQKVQDDYENTTENFEFEQIPVMDDHEIPDYEELSEDENENLEETTPEEEQELQTQIAQLLESNPDLYGLDDESWTLGTKYFKSRSVYELSIMRFLSTLEKGLKLSSIELAKAFSKYLYKDHDEVKRAPTVYRSMFSHMLKFFNLTEKGNLKVLIPGLYNSLNDFERDYVPKHSKEFTAEDIKKYLCLKLQDPEYILQAAFSVSAISNASRANEGGITQVFGNVIITTNSLH